MSPMKFGDKAKSLSTMQLSWVTVLRQMETERCAGNQELIVVDKFFREVFAGNKLQGFHREKIEMLVRQGWLKVENDIAGKTKFYSLTNAARSVLDSNLSFAAVKSWAVGSRGN